MNGNDRAPVNVGETFDVTVEAVGEKGDGVCRKNGFVLFVPDVKEGDRIKIQVTKVLKKVGFAEKIGEADPESNNAKIPRGPEVQPEEKRAFEDSENFGDDLEEKEEEQSNFSDDLADLEDDSFGSKEKSDLEDLDVPKPPK